MSDPVLERFHRALIEEIQTQYPEYLKGPFTVAEIYQNLVPYASHRDRIGVEMNGDYEDALIRLLAGEGGYLILDSPPALRELRTELEAQNPNTGLYREFAAVDVRLNQAYLDLSSSALDQLPDLVEEFQAEDPVTMAALAPSERTFGAGTIDIVPPGVDIFAMAELDAAQTAPRSSTADPSRSGPRAASASEAASDGAGHTQSGPASGAKAVTRPPLAPEFVEDEVGDDAPDRVERVASTNVRARGPDGACLWCREDLPVRDKLNFCPFCGTDLRLVPCKMCGDELEPGWRFCASCGTPADEDGAGD
jgi:hypothetical protein